MLITSFVFLLEQIFLLQTGTFTLLLSPPLLSSPLLLEYLFFFFLSIRG
jgi:hypothetical protein